jgi:hypothetical protein
MNSATSNLIILTAEVNEDKIVGSAIDGEIDVLFAVAQSEVNRQIFLPSANLVVSGKFRLGRDACSVGISISSVIAVVSLPVATPNESAYQTTATLASGDSDRLCYFDRSEVVATAIDRS